MQNIFSGEKAQLSRTKEMPMAQEKTILIVDDDAQNIEILVRELVVHHYQVTTAENGFDAVEKAKKYTPDLIITDADLPDLNGIALLQNLKETPETEKIPVIFLTERSGLQDRLRAFEAGVRDYMVKPLHVAEIVARVNMIFGRHRRLEAATVHSASGQKGRLEENSVAQLIAQLGVLRWSGILNVTNRFQKSGQIFFRNGAVVNGIYGGFRGQRAILQMMTWDKGVYSLVSQSVDVADDIPVSNLGLLLQGFDRIHQREELLSQLPSPETVFSVKSDFLRLLEERPVSPDVRKFVELFDGRLSVLQILDESPYDDLTTLARIVKMYGQGFLEELKTVEEPEAVFEEEELKVLFSEEEYESFGKRVPEKKGISEPYLVVFGTTQSGKSEFVRTLVGNQYRTRSWKNVFPFPLDLGRVRLQENTDVIVTGIPIEKQVHAIVNALANRMLGYIFLVNAAQPEQLDYLNYLIKSFRNRFQLPYAVAVTQLRHPKALGIEEISQRLGLESYEELIPCNPKDLDNVKMILLNMVPPYSVEKNVALRFHQQKQMSN